MGCRYVCEPGAFGAEVIDEMSRTVLLGKQVRQNSYPSHSHSGEKQTNHLDNLQLASRTSKVNIVGRPSYSHGPWHTEGTEGEGITIYLTNISKFMSLYNYVGTPSVVGWNRGAGTEAYMGET